MEQTSTDGKLTITFTSITRNSAEFEWGWDTSDQGAGLLTVVGGEETITVTRTSSSINYGTGEAAGLSAETEYEFYKNGDATGITFTTLSDDPKIAKESQWEDLASRVKEAQAGGIKTLTPADYNYPTSGTATSAALWLLEPGIYKCKEAMSVRISSDTSSISVTKGTILIVGHPDSGTCSAMMISSVFAPAAFYLNADGTLNSQISLGTVDDLTTNSSISPLSANQGKVLNEKIESSIINGGTTAPTTSTVGTVGTQYNCVNSGTPEIYICTAVSGSTYTWTKIN